MANRTNLKNGYAVDSFTVPSFATITVGTETTNVVNAVIQLYADDGSQFELDNVATVEYWISDASSGVGVAATAPSGGLAIGTDGDIHVVVTGKVGYLTSEADGDIDVDMTETGTDAFYLVLRMPTGRLIVSTAFTFAA